MRRTVLSPITCVSVTVTIMYFELEVVSKLATKKLCRKREGRRARTLHPQVQWLRPAVGRAHGESSAHHGCGHRRLRRHAHGVLQSAGDEVERAQGTSALEAAKPNAVEQLEAKFAQMLVELKWSRAEASTAIRDSDHSP